MDIVYATFTAWVTPEVQIVEGEAWRADDPIVKRHPDKFQAQPKIVRTTLPRHLRTTPVEQATAAPGEKRPPVSTRTDAAFDEAEEIRGQLGELGVTVDKRWGLARLRDELDKATRG